MHWRGSERLMTAWGASRTLLVQMHIGGAGQRSPAQSNHGFGRIRIQCRYPKALFCAISEGLCLNEELHY